MCLFFYIFVLVCCVSLYCIYIIFSTVLYCTLFGVPLLVSPLCFPYCFCANLFLCLCIKYCRVLLLLLVFTFCCVSLCTSGVYFVKAFFYFVYIQLFYFYINFSTFYINGDLFYWGLVAIRLQGLLAGMWDFLHVGFLACH